MSEKNQKFDNIFTVDFPKPGDPVSFYWRTENNIWHGFYGTTVVGRSCVDGENFFYTVINPFGLLGERRDSFLASITYVAAENVWKGSFGKGPAEVLEEFGKFSLTKVFVPGQNIRILFPGKGGGVLEARIFVMKLQEGTVHYRVFSDSLSNPLRVPNQGEIFSNSAGQFFAYPDRPIEVERIGS